VERDLLQLGIGIGLHLPLDHFLFLHGLEAREEITQIEGGGQRGHRQGCQQLEK